MKKYFAYIRVSTVKQGERGSSLTEQRSAIEAYAARNSLVIDTWFEEMETAAKQGRRQFSQMLADLEAGKAGGLIIHKIDRSARNLKDWSNLGDLIDRGIDVRFVSDNFDLLSRGGRLSADIQAVVAADYIRNLREEVRKGIYGRLKQGIYPFAAPVGYLNGGKAAPKTIDPINGPLIRQLFERYAIGTIGFEELRQEFWHKGLRTESGKPLSLHKLSLILNNPFYVGVIRIRTTGETFSGIHEPLISKALFERVQAIIRGKTVPKAVKHEFLLRQMVKCGACGQRTLTGELQKGHLYYRCHGRNCRGVSWRADVLEGVALASIARIRFDDRDIGDFRDMVEEECTKRGESIEKLKASLALRLQNLDARIGRLTDLLIDGTIDATTFHARKEGLLMERRGLAEQLEKTDLRAPLKELFERFELQNSELLRYEILTYDEKREILQIVCSNFSVEGKNPVFTLRNPYREIAELQNITECGPIRNDVRTRKIFEILKESTHEGANDNDLRAEYPLAA
jgi:site-specific DNA recombinase